MVTYPPNPIHSESEKKLIYLMAKLLLEQLEIEDTRSNRELDGIALTDKEADELIRLLESLINSREFLESCHFVEELSQPGGKDDSQIREIYLAARKRRGRSRAMASTNWYAFQKRMGLLGQARPESRGGPMSIEYFKMMEEKLLANLGLHPRVIYFIMNIITDNDSELEKLRNGETPLTHGSIKPLVADPIFRWRGRREEVRDLQISKTRISAAITIVADLSVLFTTRDWSVTGALSTMAGALVAVSPTGDS